MQPLHYIPIRVSKAGMLNGYKFTMAMMPHNPAILKVYGPRIPAHVPSSNKNIHIIINYQLVFFYVHDKYLPMKKPPKTIEKPISV